MSKCTTADKLYYWVASPIAFVAITYLFINAGLVSDFKGFAVAFGSILIATVALMSCAALPYVLYMNQGETTWQIGNPKRPQWKRVFINLPNGYHLFAPSIEGASMRNYLRMAFECLYKRELRIRLMESGANGLCPQYYHRKFWLLFEKH